MSRQRNFAAEYQARKAREAERGSTVYRSRVARGARHDLNPRQSVGHARTDERSASTIFGTSDWKTPFFATTDTGPGLVDVPLTREQAVRAGRYMARVGALRP